MAAQQRDELLAELSRTVSEAAAYLARVDEHLSDGHHTARGVLSNLVFWHEEYVAIARSLRDGRRPNLRSESYSRLDQIARIEYRMDPMVDMAATLNALNHELIELLRGLPDWTMRYPDKEDCAPCDVAARVNAIIAHVHSAAQNLRRAEGRHAQQS